jgi:hypothetical protein
MRTIYWEKLKALGEIIEDIPVHNSSGEKSDTGRNSIIIL